MYMRQLDHHGWCCHVIALVNALIYFGKTPIPCQGDGWLELQALTGCRYCSPTMEKIEEAAAHLGLKLEPIELDVGKVLMNLPVMLVQDTVTEGVQHAYLVIGYDDDGIRLANYKGKYGDSAVDIRPWFTLKPAAGWAVRLL
jgi:hypothetical protein